MARRNGKLGGAGTTDPTVVPPEGGRPPITKNQILKEERERLAKEKRNRLRPKKRPEGVVVPPVDKEGGSASPRQFQPRNENQNKRGFTPGEQTPPNKPRFRAERFEEPGGTLDDMGPKIVGRGRPKKPMQLAPIGMKHGGMAKKGGKSKVRGAGIARKGVRPVKMR